MRKGCSNLVPGRLLQGLPLGTKLQETVLWCTLQSPSVPVSLFQSPSMAISTSMCLATSLSLAPCEEGPFLHNLGIRKGKEEPGYYPKAPTLAWPMGDRRPRAKGEASMEGRPRPWPRSTERSSPSPLWAVRTWAWAPCAGVYSGFLSHAGDLSNSEVPSRLVKGQRQLPKGIWGSVRKRKFVLGRPHAVSALQTILWQWSQRLDSLQKWTGRQ